MSKAFGLCRFKSTGNIYWCVYNGTSDVMNPWLCTSEDITDDEGHINVFSILKEKRPWEPVERLIDIDDVDLYSDYGGGFYWSGTGSELNRRILSNLMPFDECYDDVKDGSPDWVSVFLQQSERRQVTNDM